MTVLVLTLLLNLAAAHSISADFPSASLHSTETAAGECTDPRFIAAEHEAYLVLDQSRKDAAKALADKITEIEATYRRRSDEKDRSYQRKLGDCVNNDDECTFKAKRERDADMITIQRDHDQGIYDAQGVEQAANEKAQTIYNDKVEEAQASLLQELVSGRVDRDHYLPTDQNGFLQKDDYSAPVGNEQDRGRRGQHRHHYNL